MDCRLGDRRHAVKLETTAWDRETKHCDGAQMYAKLADDLFARRDFESSYACYSKARTGVMKCLRGRYLAAFNVGAYSFALRDAMEVIYTDPTDPIGYITAGNYYQSRQDYANAEAIYHAGTLSADSGHGQYPILEHLYEASRLLRLHDTEPSQDLPPAARAVDPVERLPRELVLKVLEQVDLSQRVNLLHLSKAWYAAVTTSLLDDTELDLERSKWPLTITRFSQLLSSTSGLVEKISLGRVTHEHANACCELVLFGTRGGEKAIDLDLLSSLRVFRTTTCTSLFSDMETRLQGSWSVLSQLEELRVRIENSPDVVRLFASGKFPELRVLECYAVPDIVRSWEDLAFLNDTKSYRKQPQLKVLRLGGPARHDSSFPYVQPPKSSIISPRSLQRLLYLVPELEELQLVNINARRITDDMLSHHRVSLRLNLRVLTPCLRVLDVSLSRMRAFPLVPATCEVIHMDCCELLCIRNCETFRGIRYYDDVLDNEGDGYFLQEVADEYTSVTDLSIVRSRRNFEKIFDALARCDGARLTRLNLHGCRTIDFSQALPASSDFAKHHEWYGFEDDPRMSHTAELLVHMFRNLEELRVGCNDTVTDVAVDSFKALDNLRVFEVACTKVTEHGLASLILKDFQPRRDQRVSELARLKLFRAAALAGETEGFRPVLANVIASKQQMSARSISAFRIVDVAVTVIDHSTDVDQYK